VPPANRTQISNMSEIFWLQFPFH